MKSAPMRILTYGYLMAGHTLGVDSDLLDDRLPAVCWNAA
jgi:hypothetical protein